MKKTLIVAAIALSCTGCISKFTGTVEKELFQGYAKYNDLYSIRLETGEEIEIVADDLQLDDPVTVYFIFEYPYKTVYGYK